MRRAFADTPEGQVHYVEAGSGAPLLLLHHTPRSWTFYRELLPLLAEHRRVIAMDTLGFGDSDPPPEGFTAEDLARNTRHFLDALDVPEADVVAAMTGTRVAVELAVLHPERVRTLALLAFPFFASEEEQQERMEASWREGMGVPERDGSHVVKLWEYVLDNLAATAGDSSHEPGMYVRRDDDRRPLELSDVQLEYLHDWMVDAIRAGALWRETARAVYSADPRARLPLVAAPTLFIACTGAGFPPFLQAHHTRMAQELLAGSELVVIDAPDADSRVVAFHAREIADAVLAFLARSDRGPDDRAPDDRGRDPSSAPQ